MRAVSPYTGALGSGEPQAVSWTEVPDPAPGPGEVLVEVRSAALNRGDLLQMSGLYPPPPGASQVPGLEAAGVVLEVGGGTENDLSTPQEFAVGDPVVALLAGGGQAERVSVPAAQLMRKPESLSWIEAGGLAEVAITSWTNLVYEGGLVAGQTVLITAAASGVGSYCVRLAAALGARVLVAGRKPSRLRRLLALGAEDFVTLDEDLVEQVRKIAPEGVDLVIDLVGGPEWGRLLGAIKDRGRLVLVGLLGGTEAKISLGEVLRRRLEIRGSVLRSRSVGEKAGLIRSFEKFAEGRWDSGVMTPMIDRALPFERAADAYRSLAQEEVFGKIVLTDGE